MDRPEINIVWFKRDLRLSDHEPLTAAFATGKPTLLLYNFEPSLLDDVHYTDRHWRFIWQSIIDMNQQLERYSGQLYCFSEPMVDLLQRLSQRYAFTLYSHEEIGLDITYQRDKAVKNWCRQAGVQWLEFAYGAVTRGLQHRRDWDKHWRAVMEKTLSTPDWSAYRPCSLDKYKPPRLPSNYTQTTPAFQHGGPQQARDTLDTFLEDRGARYRGSISSPSKSRIHCSRLSPYLAWGNLSLRQVYQRTQTRFHAEGTSPFWKKALNAFKSRLHWRCHFIQKFESECRIEFEPLNRGYLEFPYRNDERAQEDIERWAAGETGIPIIDACMRCLKETGYVNFRMRAMLVSFVTHHLNISWQQASLPLAQTFLDFEPGIHYPQIQMQASVTGINTIRIYNPIKQSQDQDEDGVFIKEWCPELRTIDPTQIHTPWEHESHCEYRAPMIDIVEAAREARTRLWSYRSQENVKSEIPRILTKHISPRPSSQKNFGGQ